MTSPKTITVLLADDHMIVRQGLRALLQGTAAFQVVGEAQNGVEAVTMARELRPHVVVMDIAMPVLNGIEATRQIMAADPSARVLVLTSHSDDTYVDHLIERGALGFLEKQMSAEVLTRAIREVAQGRAYFSPMIARRLRNDQNSSRQAVGYAKAGRLRLTAREAEVLQWVAEGLANRQIATKLRISIKTVEKHRQHLMEKLNIHETAGLTRYAVAAGIGARRAT